MMRYVALYAGGLIVLALFLTCTDENVKPYTPTGVGPDYSMYMYSYCGDYALTGTCLQGQEVISIRLEERQRHYNLTVDNLPGFASMAVTLSGNRPNSCRSERVGLNIDPREIRYFDTTAVLQGQVMPDEGGIVIEYSITYPGRHGDLHFDCRLQGIKVGNGSTGDLPYN